MERLAWMPGRARYSLFNLVAAFRNRAAGEKLADIGKGQSRPMRVALLRRRAISDMRLHRMGLFADRLGLDDMYVPHAAVREASRNEPGRRRPRRRSRRSLATSASSTCGISCCRDSDKLGMASSLEIRVPMLDRRVMDLAFSIPGNIRLPSGRADKHLLRKAFPPSSCASCKPRASTRFALPIGRWMAGPLRELCEVRYAGSRVAR